MAVIFAALLAYKSTESEPHPLRNEPSAAALTDRHCAVVSTEKQDLLPYLTKLTDRPHFNPLLLVLHVLHLKLYVRVLVDVAAGHPSKYNESPRCRGIIVHRVGSRVIPSIAS
jgi:hypothetical protein